jgi:hypothetical protein
MGGRIDDNLRKGIIVIRSLTEHKIISINFIGSIKN